MQTLLPPAALLIPTAALPPGSGDKEGKETRAEQPPCSAPRGQGGLKGGLSSRPKAGELTLNQEYTAQCHQKRSSVTQEQNQHTGPEGMT